MRKWKVVAATLFWTTATAGIVDACGDKFLVNSCASRMDQTARPAKILILGESGEQSRSVEMLLSLKVQRRLQDSGHRVIVCRAVQECEQELRTGEYDIVLASLSAANLLRREVSGDGNGAEIIPVLEKPSKEDLKSVKEEFRYVFSGPKSESDTVRAINQVAALTR